MVSEHHKMFMQHTTIKLYIYTDMNICIHIKIITLTNVARRRVITEFFHVQVARVDVVKFIFLLVPC